MGVGGFVELVPFSTLLTDPSLVSLLPDGAPQPLFTYKYPRTLGAELFNYDYIARMTATQLDSFLQAPCPCQQPKYAQFLPPGHHHVFTNDPAVLEDPALAALALKGTKHRLQRPQKETFYSSSG